MTTAKQPEAGFVTINIGAQRVTIPATHHMPNMEKSAEFNRIVLDFLQGLS